MARRIGLRISSVGGGIEDDANGLPVRMLMAEGSIRAVNRRCIVPGDFTKTISQIGTAGEEVSTKHEAPRLIVVCEYGRLMAPGLRVALGDSRK